MVSSNKRFAFYICKSAMMNIFCYGKHIHYKIMKLTKTNIISNTYLLPSHGLSQKPSNNKCLANNELNLFFNALQKEGLPSPERIIRNFLSIDVRDDSKLICLPSYYRVRTLYLRFCYQNGYKITYDNKMRQNNSFIGIDDERKHICSWPTFISFWKNKYNHIKISPPYTDTCTICYQYSLLICFIQKQRSESKLIRSHKPNSTNNSSCTSTQDNIITQTPEFFSNFDPYNYVIRNFNEDEFKYSLWKEINSKNNNNECNDINNDYVLEEEIEELRDNFFKHMVSYKHQRSYVNIQKKKSQMSYSQINDKNILTTDLNDVFYADYCQNLELPHFGQVQPSEIYYFSPLSISCFGIYNCKNNKLYSYIYHEGNSNKGGDAVCSLIWKFLQDVNIISNDSNNNKVSQSLRS